jgi:transcriptional regulator with XRE-family HTH domain
MFISEEEARARLANPRNLANRFGRNYASNDPRAATAETEKADSETKEQKSESISNVPAGSDGPHNGDRISLQSIPRKGRRGPWLSVEERTEISISAKTSGLNGERKQTQEEIAEAHGISRQAVAQINSARGNGQVDQQHIETALEIARNKALDRLMVSLGLLTDDKIAATDAYKTSLIAAQMAKVVERTMPDTSRGGNLNLIIYTPELKTEKSFDVVEV